MARRFFVPKFITIEDKLLGLITFKQLFALFGAFLISFFSFKIGGFSIGIIIGLLSWSIALLFFFVYINGKPFYKNFPLIVRAFFRERKWIWKKIMKVSYKEIPLLIDFDFNKLNIPKPEIKPREIVNNNLILEINYPGIDPKFKEKIVVSLEEPFSKQAELINKIYHYHQHSFNPNNPYRLFPYIKFFKTEEE